MKRHLRIVAPSVAWLALALTVPGPSPVSAQEAGLAPSIQPLASEPQGLPFTLSYQEKKYPDGSGPPKLQSEAIIRTKTGEWLIIGGRNVGLHSFGPGVPTSNFPAKTFNPDLFVVDPRTGQSWSFDTNKLPPELGDPLRTTNSQPYYDPATDRWYLIGGYGYATKTGELKTFNTLTTFVVSDLVAAIKDPDPNPDRVANLIKQSTDDRFIVTGGGLEKLGDRFYLVFGHNFQGQYVGFGGGPFSQTYTEAVRIFTLDDKTLKILAYGEVTSSDQIEHPFHRRDLNIIPVIDPATGAARITAFGGVFPPGKLAGYPNPVVIDDNSSAVPVTSFRQKMNLYDCATIPMYDSKSRTMYVTFFGGISAHYVNPHAVVVNHDDGLPWINHIATVAHGPGDQPAYHEYLAPQPIPGRRYLGAEARFLADPALVQNGQIDGRGILKLEMFPDGSRSHVGYIYGGIEAPGPQPGSTQSTNVVFDVYLSRQAGPAIHVGSSEPARVAAGNRP